MNEPRPSVVGNRLLVGRIDERAGDRRPRGQDGEAVVRRRREAVDQRNVEGPPESSRAAHAHRVEFSRRIIADDH